MSPVAKKPVVGFFSHQGPREGNEDTVLGIQLTDGRWLVAVADGMGGLAKGELASKTALGALYRQLSGGAGLMSAVLEANTAVYEESQGRDMGTTLVAAVVAGETAEIANVGDSRAYHLDPLGLVQVTRDHTIAEEAATQGTLTEEEAAGTPWGGALSRYLGGAKNVEVDYFGPVSIHEGGWLLLCSDGLHGVFSLEELEAVLSQEVDPNAAARRLVEEALERGTQDNTSAVLVYNPLPERGVGMPTTDLPKRDSTWDPGRFLNRPGGAKYKRGKRGPWARFFRWFLILLLVGLTSAAGWWFTNNAR